MERIAVKVCGMRDADNIRAVSELDIDMMGFIFWPRSPRFVRMISSSAGIIPDYSAERLKTQIGKVDDAAAALRGIKRVGVFVDDMPQNIVTRTYNYSLDYIQLHGDEPRETCENIRATIDPDIHPGIRIIKAISISDPRDLDRCRDYAGVVDLFLFDTRCSTVGGSGMPFDWHILDAYDGDIPFLLSGGIGPESAARVKAFSHPRFVGVDLNSRFETSPGVKDVALLRTFINEIRNENE